MEVSSLCHRVLIYSAIDHVANSRTKLFLNIFFDLNRDGIDRFKTLCIHFVHLESKLLVIKDWSFYIQSVRRVKTILRIQCRGKLAIFLALILNSVPTGKIILCTAVSI